MFRAANGGFEATAEVSNYRCVRSQQILPYRQGILLCIAAKIAVVQAGRSKPESANSQVAQNSGSMRVQRMQVQSACERRRHMYIDDFSASAHLPDVVSKARRPWLIRDHPLQKSCLKARDAIRALFRGAGRRESYHFRWYGHRRELHPFQAVPFSSMRASAVLPGVINNVSMPYSGQTEAAWMPSRSRDYPRRRSLRFPL